MKRNKWGKGGFDECSKWEWAGVNESESKWLWRGWGQRKRKDTLEHVGLSKKPPWNARVVMLKRGGCARACSHARNYLSLFFIHAQAQGRAFKLAPEGSKLNFSVSCPCLSIVLCTRACPKILRYYLSRWGPRSSLLTCAWAWVPLFCNFTFPT